MNLKKTNIALAACLAAFSSCKDMMPWNEESKGNVTIVARMDGNIPTRTCVDGSSPEGTVGILWSPGDRIGVYGSNGAKNALFESSHTEATPEAIFSGSLPNGESPEYAYYPYSDENVSADISSIKGNLKLTQNFSLATGTLEADYKVGTPTFTASEGGKYGFTFEHVFSLLRFDIDASGTKLEGDNLESISISLPENRRLGGEFMLNAKTKAVTWSGTEEKANELAMAWTDNPVLGSGAQYTGYMTCAPAVRKGDPIRVTVLSHKYKAEFTCTALADFAANTCYTFPLTLKNYKNIVITARPVITSFSFEATRNAGKILDTKLVFKDGATSPVGNSSEVLQVGADIIKGCIPYLYDFKLKPSFTVTEGLTVKVDGTQQVSGESEQNFSQPVAYTVSNGTESRTYIVKVTNSGLPVVVLTQSGGGTVEWKPAGIKVRSKESEWVKTDMLSIYNADGSVDVAHAACGARLRGNSTQNYPKLPFAIKFDKKQAVLGMAKHKRWVLLANWMDRTMLRNAIAFDVAHKTADAYADGLGWSPHGQSVELVVDGRHVGNYYLCEQIKIDANRVNIKDCYEDVVEGGNANPTVADCGYLLECDDAMDEANCFRTDRGLPFMFKDVVPDALLEAVQSKVKTIEADLKSGNYAAAYEQLDVNSVIDYFFVQELVSNDEYKHPKSVYMFIDGMGKLTAGPLWDFDWQTFVIPEQVRAFGYTTPEYNCRDAGEWLYGASKLAEKDWPWESPNWKSDQPYMWYPLLFKDASFRTKVQQRWKVIYPKLLSVEAEIERQAAANRLSDKYNFAMWPTTRNLKNTCGAAFNGDEEMSFGESIQSMKKAYNERLDWMNVQISSGTFVTDAK